jgi:plasmid maintenance system antidote protein VapI
MVDRDISQRDLAALIGVHETTVSKFVNRSRGVGYEFRHKAVTAGVLPKEAL